MVFSITRSRRRGMAVVMVVLLILAAVISAVQLYFFSRNVYRRTARTAFGTSAEYLAEAICAEGLQILGQGANDPVSPFYRLFREGVDTQETFVPVALFDRLTSPDLIDAFRPYPIDQMKGQFDIRFGPPPDPFVPMEREGLVTIIGEVRGNFLKGQETYRRVEVTRRFIVQLTTPPPPFDRGVFSLLEPDYINGPSKQSLDADILEPTNQAIPAVNQLNAGYRRMVDFAKNTIKWTDCQSLPYISGNPPFITPRIFPQSRIPEDFFLQDSILMGAPANGEIGRLENFNYEDILRTQWPPLKQMFDTVFQISSVNLQVLQVTIPLLAAIPGKAESTATLVAAPAIAAIHQALEVIVPIQIIAGQVTLGALKLILDGFIIGQFAKIVRALEEGDTGPAFDAVATIAGDVASSGVLDRVGQQSHNLGNLGDTARLGSVIPGEGAAAAGGTAAAGGASAGTGSDAAGGGFGDAVLDGLRDRVGQTRDEALNDPEGFLRDNETQLATLQEGFAGGTGGLEGLGDDLGMLTSSEALDGVQLDKIGEDTSFGNLTGLIKGFIETHRSAFTVEPPRGSRTHALFASRFQRLAPAIFRARSLVHLDGQEGLAAHLDRYRESGVNGVLVVQASEPVRIDLDRFKGRATLFATAGLEVKRARLADPRMDSLVLATTGPLLLPAGRTDASLLALREDGQALAFDGDPEVFGNLVLHRYTADDNRAGGPHRLRGSLTINPRLSVQDGDRQKRSHFWVTLSPIERSREVFLQ